MSRNICLGFHGMPCLRKNCWCGGEIYAHGPAEDNSDYCIECIKKIKEKER